MSLYSGSLTQEYSTQQILQRRTSDNHWNYCKKHRVKNNVLQPQPAHLSMTMDSENAGICKQLGYKEIWQCVTRCVCHSHLMWRLK